MSGKLKRYYENVGVGPMPKVSNSKWGRKGLPIGPQNSFNARPAVAPQRQFAELRRRTIGDDDPSGAR